ncbi:MAG: hypothetical protein DME24_01090 [Verrucomicrobia bacterium]|nr:MAG: hypothetical protein DME24_01090 [Verrucomicrobiota bacterium]
MKNRTPNTNGGEQEATPKAYLDKSAVAAILQVTPRCVDNWMKRGILPFYRIGRTIRFDADGIRAHLEATCRVGGGR